MRRILLLPIALAASLGLSACSEKTQDNAAKTADSVGNDVEAAGAAAGDAAKEGAAKAGDAVSDAGKAVGHAADKAAAKTDELGDKAENARAHAEADLHNESVKEAKSD